MNENNVLDRVNTHDLFKPCPTCSGSGKVILHDITHLLLSKDLLQGKRILITDNDKTTREIISVYLYCAGAFTHQVEGGQSIIDALEKEDFDLIIMAPDIPVLDGYKTTALIRSGKAFKRFKMYKHLPIIALMDQSLIENVLKAGMNDYILKPITRKGVLTTIFQWLR